MFMRFNVKDGLYFEDIYRIAGRDDKVAILYLMEGSASYKLFGPTITVVFLYSQFERERLEKLFSEGGIGKVHRKIKALFLEGAQLSQDQIENLKTEGINTEEIREIITGLNSENLFHEKKTRSIRTHEIPINRMPKGGDYDWIYNMKKQLVSSGIILFPDERDFYLALKLFYEKENLTPDEIKEIGFQSVLKPEIELKYLEIKLEKELISPEEDKKLDELIKMHAERNYKIFEEEINNAGISFRQLVKEYGQLFRFFVKGTTHFTTYRLNSIGKHPIYIDWTGFLHIFLRHVKEFDVGKTYSQKTKFLWELKDIDTVMKNVILAQDDEIQMFWGINPGKRYSKYGDQSLYFEGDCYTFHIEGDGRLSTFHRSNVIT
jgi:hypothetical protein